MVTGYDHLLFLVGVIFFLYRLKDILLYVSRFTVGHSLTLLGGALGGIQASAYLHGWYWENPGSDPITIRLTSSGFYSAAVEIRSDRTRSNRDLRPLTTLSPSPERAEETTR